MEKVSLDEDIVKRAYMLLALRYIVYPSNHNYFPVSCLDLVQDVSSLNKKRWATFVITSLMKLYATKGSITTPKRNLPLECNKHGKKTHDKLRCFGAIRAGEAKNVRRYPHMDRNIQNNVIIKKFASMFNTEYQNIEHKGKRHVVTAKDATQIVGIKDGEEEIKMPVREMSETDHAKKSMFGDKLDELSIIDPKHAKRYFVIGYGEIGGLLHDQKERKMRYITKLERKVQTLQTEATSLSAQLTLLQVCLSSYNANWVKLE
ncbi:hypothetical protein Tco_0390386 [Tanacetum coccineum]